MCIFGKRFFQRETHYWYHARYTFCKINIGTSVNKREPYASYSAEIDYVLIKSIVDNMDKIMV